MTEVSPGTAPVLEWGIAGAPLENEDTSGDLSVVVPLPDGAVVAVIDGLGHGVDAAVAARAAAEAIRERAGDPLDDLVRHCHEEVRGTRGVVMSIAAFHAPSSSMAWTGVGNVAAVLLRAGRVNFDGRHVVQNRGGVVGYRLPSLAVSTLEVARGDLLVMATDGIKAGFVDDIDREARDPELLAAFLLAGFSRGTDDALVLVARYLGRAPWP